MCEVETRDIYIPEDEIAPNTILELHIGFDKRTIKKMKNTLNNYVID